MNKVKVLMIDDDENHIDMIKEYFKNHEVIEADIKSYKDVKKKSSNKNYDVVLFKPFDLMLLEKKILGMAKCENKLMEECVTSILHELGMPNNVKGYKYIIEGILLLYENPNLIRSITTKVYPKIACKFDTTSIRVERNIRHAIEISWNRGSYDFMEEIFSYSIDPIKSKPTNSEYIITIADKLRMNS